MDSEPGAGRARDSAHHASRRIQATEPTVTMSEHEENTEHHANFDLAVDEARPKLKEPPLYRVVLINDDYTPMEFVVDILQSVFGMERTRATQVMLEVHTKGKGVCGVYNFEIAETKVAQVMGIAKQHQHPLLCTMEES
jgi:ATP-dependent Clp protease adaptor protein ClpS